MEFFYIFKKVSTAEVANVKASNVRGALDKVFEDKGWQPEEVGIVDVKQILPGMENR